MAEILTEPLTPSNNGLRVRNDGMAKGRKADIVTTCFRRLFIRSTAARSNSLSSASPGGIVCFGRRQILGLVRTHLPVHSVDRLVQTVEAHTLGVLAPGILAGCIRSIE